MNLIAATEAAPIACGMLVNKPVRPASAAPAAGAVAAVGPELTVPIRSGLGFCGPSPKKLLMLKITPLTVFCNCNTSCSKPNSETNLVTMFWFLMA